MSAEYMVERLMDAVSAMEPDDIDSMASENVRSGGYFFDLTYRGREYQVEVTEMATR